MTAPLSLIPPNLFSSFYVFRMTSLWKGLICWVQKASYSRRGDLGLCRVARLGWAAVALASDQRFSDFKPWKPPVLCVPFSATLKDLSRTYGTINNQMDPLPSGVKSASALDPVSRVPTKAKKSDIPSLLTLTMGRCSISGML